MFQKKAAHLLFVLLSNSMMRGMAWGKLSSESTASARLSSKADLIPVISYQVLVLLLGTSKTTEHPQCLPFEEVYL